MTVTTPGSPPRRRPPRRVPRLAVVAAALTVLTALLLPAAAAAAPSPSPTPTPSPSVPAGTTVFTLSPVSNGIVRPGEALTVSVGLQNGTDAALPPSAVSLSIGAAPLADRDALSAWLGGDLSGVSLTVAGGAALEAVDPGSEQVAAITVAAADSALAGRAPGVYPLAASYTAASGTVTSTSVMIVPADDRPEVGIGVIVPITAAPLEGGLLTADELAVLTAPDGELTAQVDAVTGTTVILAVDPAIPAAIRVLGTAAPESATAWLARLDALPNSRFALQFGDADVTAQLQSGLPRPLAPTSFAAYMTPADFPPATPSPTPTPSPTATADPENPLPDTADLLAVGEPSRAAVFWPADGTADSAVVTRLGELGDGDTPALTILPSTTTTAGAGGDSVSARGRVGDAGVLVYDEAISSALHEASLREMAWLRGAALAEATAYLDFATAESDGPLLVTLGRDHERSRVGLATAIATASAAPNVAPRTLGGLAASEADPLELTDIEDAADRAAAASALVADEGQVARFATILDEPSLLTGPERAELLQLLGVRWVGDEAWPTALTAHRTSTAETLDSVALLPTSPSDLYGSNASLRFWVRNDLEYPVNLVLYTTPDNLRLDVQTETTIVATPQSNTRVEVPVQARVGRGEVTLALQLRSPTFVAVGEPETVRVNVWAEWEGVGIAALAVVVGTLLVIGIVRTVLRVRGRKPADQDAAAPGDAARGDAAEGDAAESPRERASEGDER